MLVKIIRIIKMRITFLLMQITRTSVSTDKKEPLIIAVLIIHPSKSERLFSYAFTARIIRNIREQLFLKV